MAFDMNMDPLAQTTEKSHHLLYLKDFRTQQCPLFLQHKCTQHRPYTCFHWHFRNQKRRRIVRREDGTFSYCATDYCAKYDEATGICPDGDDCNALHKPANDVERKYHLRYYKTSTCIYETDAKGHCVRNGSHCPYAHGASDLRVPVFDVRELGSFRTRLPSLGDQPQAVEFQPNASAARCLDTLEREVGLSVIEPVWNDIVYVLLNYKTETCAKPPRLCRQGYACPFSHNQKDRRRSPLTFRYRSTPCPNVKHGDEWGDPGLCRQEDSCQYCHTRTEQQFHHEIFKSTKCNDMLQTGFCPRGPFCAFAHVPEEITIARTGLMNQFNSSNLSQYIKNNAQTAAMMGTVDHAASSVVPPIPGPTPSTPTSSPPSNSFAMSNSNVNPNSNTAQKRDTNNNQAMNANAAVNNQNVFGNSDSGAAFDIHCAQNGSSVWQQLSRSRLNSITEEQLCANLMQSLQSRPSDLQPAESAPLSSMLHYANDCRPPHERFHSVGCDRPSSTAYDFWQPDFTRNMSHYEIDTGCTSLGNESRFPSGPAAPFNHLQQVDTPPLNMSSGMSHQYHAAMRTRHFSGPAYVRQLSAGANGYATAGVPPSAFAFANSPFAPNGAFPTPNSSERRGSSEQEALASAGDTVESVIGSALEDPSDFHFGELSITDAADGVDHNQSRAMFAMNNCVMRDGLVSGERRASAFDYGSQGPPAFVNYQGDACGLEAYYDYDGARVDDRRCSASDGAQHLASGDLLRMQEQRIFAASNGD